MFWTLQRLYNSGQLDKQGLKVAVFEKGWIAPEQFKEITGEDINESSD
ncbi:XkdX family protein [Sporosarcina sp. USHLN248]